LEHILAEVRVSYNSATMGNALKSATSFATVCGVTQGMADAKPRSHSFNRSMASAIHAERIPPWDGKPPWPLKAKLHK
jgi:hypothetical protein